MFEILCHSTKIVKGERQAKFIWACPNRILFKAKPKIAKSTTQHIERFRILSEDRLARQDNVVALFKYEFQWNNDRKALWNSTIPEEEKQAKHQQLLSDLEAKTMEILGAELGRWYIHYRTIEQQAYTDMDKYKTPYADAYRIAVIECEYTAKRQAILAVKRPHYSETQELLDACDAELLQTIRKQVTGTPGSKWTQYHSDRLASELKTRYGLDASAVAKFKSAYNKFAIEEYKILYSNKNLSREQKQSALKKLGNEFCTTVQPLFPDQGFGQWKGRWAYQHQKRIVQKLAL